MEEQEMKKKAANLEASVSDIRGGMTYVTVAYDNGYAVKVGGELFPKATFIAYKSSIKNWEAPHEQEILTPEMKNKLIADVEKLNAPGKVTIKFE